MQPSELATNESVRRSFAPAKGLAAQCMELLLLFGAGLAVRFTSLVRKPFWFDECFSVELARIDWRNFLHLLWWREANMSLYYVLLRIWLHFGSSELFIRSLSVLIAAATIPSVYWVARMLFDRRVALIAAALFAFNGYDVRYAQEARSYALFALLATLSSGFLIAWLREPTRRNRAGYILASVLAAYAHFYALLLIVAHWVALRTLAASFAPRASSGTAEAVPFPKLETRNSSRTLRGAWTIIAIAVAPLLIFVAKTGAGPIKWIPRPGVRDLLDFFEHLAGSNSWPLPVIYAAGCIAALAPAGRRLVARNQPWEIWRYQFLLIWLFFPIVLTMLLSFARPVFLARYMIFCLPALLMLVAAGLARLRPNWLLAPVLAIILFFAWRGIWFVYANDFDNERDSSAAASNFILDHAQSGDAVLFHIAETRVPYEFVRSIRARENTASPSFARQLGPEIIYPHHAAGLDYRDYTGKPSAEFVRSAAPPYSRLWVMLMNNGPADKPDPTTVMLTNVLPQYFPRMQRWQMARVEVRLYSKQ